LERDPAELETTTTGLSVTHRGCDYGVVEPNALSVAERAGVPVLPEGLLVPRNGPFGPFFGCTLFRVEVNSCSHTENVTSAPRSVG
jgi:hypothetical protein